jgi:hypothetical protein
MREVGGNYIDIFLSLLQKRKLLTAVDCCAREILMKGEM